MPSGIRERSLSAAWWCPGGHLQTIWAGILRPAPSVPLVRARWELPDGDFLDIDELAAKSSAPRLIVLHGLESSSRATAVLGLLHHAHRRGWGGVAVNFRGCSGEPNRLRRSYHGGETADLTWVIDQVRAQHPSIPILCAGFSLGGNVLLKYLGEQGQALPEPLRAAATISAPFDLSLSAHALEDGFSRVYRHRLVRSLKRKTFEKLTRYPNLVDPEALAQAMQRIDAADGLRRPEQAHLDLDRVELVATERREPPVAEGGRDRARRDLRGERRIHGL